MNNLKCVRRAASILLRDSVSSLLIKILASVQTGRVQLLVGAVFCLPSPGRKGNFHHELIYDQLRSHWDQKVFLNPLPLFIKRKAVFV